MQVAVLHLINNPQCHQVLDAKMPLAVLYQSYLAMIENKRAKKQFGEQTGLLHHMETYLCSLAFEGQECDQQVVDVFTKLFHDKFERNCHHTVIYRHRASFYLLQS